DGADLVRTTIESESRRAHERVLSLVSFLYDPRAIRRARENLRHASKPKRALALEILKVTLDAEMRARVVPLCDEMSPVQRLLALRGHLKVPSLPELLRALVLRSDAQETAWTRSVAAYTASRLNLAEIQNAIEGLLAIRAPTPPLVRKTAA